MLSRKVLNKKFYKIEFGEKVLTISRVVKVTKGGRIFSFSVLVVIGSKNGCFGIGHGKALEINDARKKAINSAKKDLYQIVLTKDGTIPHVVEAKYGATKVIIRPAKAGTGIIAGGAMRSILECLGVKDVVAKCIGSSNCYNLSYAVVKALLKLKSSKYYTIMKNGNKKLDFNVSTDDENEEDVEDKNNVNDINDKKLDFNKSFISKNKKMSVSELSRVDAVEADDVAKENDN